MSVATAAARSLAGAELATLDRVLSSSPRARRFAASSTIGCRMGGLAHATTSEQSSGASSSAPPAM